MSIQHIQEKWDLYELNYTARAMFIAYALSEHLENEEHWLNEKYDDLVEHGDNRIQSTLEFFRMDKITQGVLLERYPELSAQDFESFRMLANNIL